MQLNQIDNLKSQINVLANLVHENEVLPEDVIKNIIINFLDLTTLSTLNLVNKSWYYQTFSLLMLAKRYSDLPRWIGIQMNCGEENPLDAYQVEERERVSLYEILEKQLGQNDSDNDLDIEGVFQNPRLTARCKQIENKCNYHICLIANAKIHANQLELKTIEFQKRSALFYLENFKGEKLELTEDLEPSTTSIPLPSIVFKLFFDNVNAYDSLMSYRRTGQSCIMLRINGVEIISSEVQGNNLQEVAKLFSQFCQKLNQKEDNEYFESLDERAEKFSLTAIEPK